MRVGGFLVLVAVVVLGTIHIPRGTRGCRHSARRVPRPPAPAVAPAVTYVAGSAVTGNETVSSVLPIRPQLVIRPWWKEGWAIRLLGNSNPDGPAPDLELRSRFFLAHFALIPQDKIGMFFDGLGISDRAALVTEIIENVLCSPWTVTCEQFPSQLKRIRQLIHGIQAGICKEEDDETAADLDLVDSYALANMPLHYALAVDGILRHLTQKAKLQGSQRFRYGKIASLIFITIEASARRAGKSIPISANDLADILLSLAQHHPAMFNDPELRRIVLHLPATPQTDRIFFLLLRPLSHSTIKVDQLLLANVAFRTTHVGYLTALRSVKRCQWLRLFRRRHIDTLFVYGAIRGLDLLLGHLPDFVTIRDQIVIDIAAHTISPPNRPLSAKRVFAGDGASHLPDVDLFEGSNLKRLCTLTKENPCLEYAEKDRALKRIKKYQCREGLMAC